MINSEDYKEYTGQENAPTNFERLKTIAISHFSNLNLNELSPECQAIYEQAIYEQILFMANADLDSHSNVKSKSLGDASVSYEYKYTGTETSPIALRMLKNSKCNFFYGGMTSYGGGCLCGKK